MSAVLWGVSFPWPGWWWAAHLALAPMTLLAICSSRPWALLWTGYGIGLVWWLLRVSWLIPVTVGGYLALAVYMAMYIPAYLLLVRCLVRACRLPLVVLVPMAWVSLELVRGWLVEGGFGWFGLGHSQAPYWEGQRAGLLVQVADLFGEHAVSFVVATTSGMLVGLLRAWWQGGGVASVAWAAVRAGFSFFWWVGVLCGACLYGVYRLHETGAELGRSLRVAVVQTNVPQDNKVFPTPEQELADWQRMIDLTVEAVAQTPKPRLVVWPETMVPAALNPEALEHYRTTRSGLRGRDAFHSEIQLLSQSLGTYLLVGAYAMEDWTVVTSSDGETRFDVAMRRYNSTYLYAPDGAQDRRRYDKIHRVPFGEYIPWVDRWPWLKWQFIHWLSPYDFDYSLQAGRGRVVFEIALDPSAPRPPEALSSSRAAVSMDTQQSDAHATSLGATGGVGGLASQDSPHSPVRVRVATPICFEDAVPRVTRKMVYNRDGQKRVDLLVNMTNDGWYARTAQPWQHLQIAVLRCIETRVPMARSVNGGISGFIDSVGRVGPLVTIAGQSQDVAGTAVATVALDGRSTRFGRWGHAPMIGMACVTGVLMLWGLAYRAPSAQKPGHS